MVMVPKPFAANKRACGKNRKSIRVGDCYSHMGGFSAVRSRCSSKGTNPNAFTIGIEHQRPGYISENPEFNLEPERMPRE